MIGHTAALAAMMLPGVLAELQADRIHALPGWSGTLPSRQWSGFLNVSTTPLRQLHYWLVESENKPHTDPVVLWLNGGPGCSSMDGLLYEHGPLHISEDGENLVRNDYTWAKAATMLYLEAPAGVGFSHSADPRDYTTDDVKTTADNLAALVAFFQGFPEFATQSFYVAGESYGGVYVPLLADAIVRAGSVPQFEGFLVGNGGPSCGAGNRNSEVEAAYGHNTISSELYERIHLQCNFSASGDYPPACAAALAEMRHCTAGLNDYDDYRDCYHHQHDGATRFAAAGRLRVSLGEPVPCIDSSQARKWLNRADVQAAIHVTAADVSTAGYWQICNAKGGGKNDTLSYHSSGIEITPIFTRLAQRYRLQVYVGDNDGGAQRTAEWCLSSLFPVKSKWSPWTYEKHCTDGGDDGSIYCQVGKQVGGYETLYNVGAVGELRYITVHGAGHMVPQWKPQAALKMFSTFLRKLPLAAERLVV